MATIPSALFIKQTVRGAELSANKEYNDGSSVIDVEESIPDSSSDLQVNVAIDVSAIESLMIVSDQDITLEANDGTTPDFTINLKANKAFVEVADGYHVSLLTDDVTSFFVTNSSGAAANLRILGTQDATPA